MYKFKKILNAQINPLIKEKKRQISKINVALNICAGNDLLIY